MPRRKIPRQSHPIRSRLAVPTLAVALIAVIFATGGTAYALQLENHDAFCASCHTEPETQFYQQSLDQNPATLAAFHTQKQTRCIDCHSGGGIFGRSEGLAQGTQDLLSYYSGNYHRPAITMNKLGDDSCVKCHSTVFAARDFNNHFHFFLPQWQGLDANAAHCIDCHTSHAAGNASQGYLSTPVVTTICQDCHNAVGAGG